LFRPAKPDHVDDGPHQLFVQVLTPLAFAVVEDNSMKTVIKKPPTTCFLAFTTALLSRLR
jgi:hypothetical protein